jgi:hypothetical protein
VITLTRRVTETIAAEGGGTLPYDHPYYWAAFARVVDPD